MQKPTNDALNRTLDVLVAAGVLLATGPVQILIAMALWFENAGPVLVGVDRLRFRTVRMDDTGRVVGRGELGHLLWQARLDELPQFISLFKGDVTLFGETGPALSIGA